MKNKFVTSLVLLFIVQLLFGGLPVASKIVLRVLTPWETVTLRSIAAALVFLLLALVTSKDKAPVRFADKFKIALLGLLGVSANQFSLFLGLQKTTAAAAVILSPNIAFVALLLSVLLGRELWTKTKVLNLLCGFLGVALLFSSHIAEVFDRQGFLGNLFCVFSTTFFASYLVLSKPLIQRVGAIRFSAGAFAAAAAFNAVVLGQLWGWDLAGALGRINEVSFLQAPFVYALLHLVVGATIITYFLNAVVLTNVDPGIVSGFVCLQPLIGITASHWILAEKVPSSYFVSLAFILFGLALLAHQSLRSSQSKVTSKI